MSIKAAVSALTLSFGNAATKGQLNFAASIAFETLPMIAANPKFKFSVFAREVEEASGYTISARTVANCATLANQLQLSYGAKIGSYAGGHRKDNVLDFAAFIAEQVKNTTYTLTLEDLIAFCKSTPSAADKRKAVVDAAAAAAAALADVKAKEAEQALTAAADAAVTGATKLLADAAATVATAEEQAAAAAAATEKANQEKMEADKRAESLAAANAELQKQAELDKANAAAAAAEAEAARKVAESFAVQVTVNEDGSPNIVVALNPSPAFMREVAKQLTAMAKAMENSAARSMKIAA
jgi:hypothetical protein